MLKRKWICPIWNNLGMERELHICSCQNKAHGVWKVEFLFCGFLIDRYNFWPWLNFNNVVMVVLLNHHLGSTAFGLLYGPFRVVLTRLLWWTHCYWVAILLSTINLFWIIVMVWHCQRFCSAMKTLVQFLHKLLRSCVNLGNQLHLALPTQVSRKGYEDFWPSCYNVW